MERDFQKENRRHITQNFNMLFFFCFPLTVELGKCHCNYACSDLTAQ